MPIARGGLTRREFLSWVTNSAASLALVPALAAAEAKQVGSLEDATEVFFLDWKMPIEGTPPIRGEHPNVERQIEEYIYLASLSVLKSGDDALYIPAASSYLHKEGFPQKKIKVPDTRAVVSTPQGSFELSQLTFQTSQYYSNPKVPAFYRSTSECLEPTWVVNKLVGSNLPAFYGRASELSMTFVKDEEFHTIWLHHLKRINHNGDGTYDVELDDGRKEKYERVLLPHPDQVDGIFWPVSHYPREGAIYGMVGGKPKKIPLERISSLEIVSTPADNIERVLNMYYKATGPNKDTGRFDPDENRTYPRHHPKVIRLHDGGEITTNDGYMVHFTWWFVPSISCSLDGKIDSSGGLDTRTHEPVKVELNFTSGETEGNPITVHYKTGEIVKEKLQWPMSDVNWNRNDKFDYATPYGRVMIPLKRVKEVVIVH